MYQSTIVKRVVVPPDSKIIVSGYADGCTQRSAYNLVEPYAFMEKKGLLVARTLVDPENIQFSIVNVSDKHIRVDKNTTVASIQPVGIVESKSDSLHKDSSELPEHLQLLFERSSKNLQEEQKLLLFDLFISYKDIFVGPDGKFGRTHIVKHTIDTGDSKPIKIPPRR